MDNIINEKRVKALGRGLSVSFMIIHAGLLFFFRHYGVTPMVWANAISIAFYILTFPMIRTGSLWIYSVLVYLEVAVHMFIAVVFVGVDSGFQLIRPKLLHGRRGGLAHGGVQHFLHGLLPELRLLGVVI